MKTFESLKFCDGVQNKKDVIGWNTLHQYNKFSSNKEFDARVYQKGNKVVIAFAGTQYNGTNDIKNSATVFRGKIPSQFGDAERLYNEVRSKYPNAEIEFTGYSLGGTISNLMSHRTGLPSIAIAPIGSEHIVKNYPNYFKYGDSNIKTYGRKGDILFNMNMGKQSGDIYIVPELEYQLKNVDKHNIFKNVAEMESKLLFKPHLIENFSNESLLKSKPNLKEGYSTGHAAPVEDIINQNNFKSHTTFTPEEIGRMSPQEFARNEKAIMQQLKNGQIKPSSVPNVDFKSFKNPENGKSTIFTREDIEKMSTKEYTKNEKAKTATGSNSGSSENGRWVTINGNHVFLEKEK